MQIKTLSELAAPDPSTLRFTSRGISLRGSMTPESAAQFQQEVIARCDLHTDVPDAIRDNYERLRKLHSRGVFFYEAFTLVADYAWIVMEHALRERFVTFFGGVIPFVNTVTEFEEELPVHDFYQVFESVTSGRYSDLNKWKLKVQSTGELMRFNGGMRNLLDWARKEGLLHGARNRNLEPIYVDSRNHVAHASYRITTPVQSARMISDTAEVINRLWGHATSGGKLYPTRLKREILVVARRREQPEDDTYEFRAQGLTEFNEAGEWSFLVIRGVFDDPHLLSFSKLFELTAFPADYLWGPGNKEEALEWLHVEDPVEDVVSYLDRPFVFQLSHGQVSLAMRPEVVATLPSGSREGEWILVKADNPFDAIAHLRHTEEGRPCNGSNARYQCPAEIMIRSGWRSLVEKLAEGVQAKFPNMA